MGIPERIKPYQTLGDLILEFPGDSTVTDYQRSLDLDAAVNTVQFTKEGVRYTRAAFISAPDQLLVVRLTANKKKKINFTVRLSRSQDAHLGSAGDNMLILRGRFGQRQGMA